VSAKERVLIVTDGTETIQLIAQSISKTMTDYELKVCTAGEFAGTDLLPAGLFFLGCEKQKPPSFAYLEEMLAHINLASRKCGIFSVNKDALEYLESIVKDCEAGLEPPFLAAGVEDSSALTNWLKEILV